MSPDSRFLFSGSSDLTLRFWELESGKELWSVCYGDHPDIGVALMVGFCKKGHVGMTCDAEGIRFWEAKSGILLRRVGLPRPIDSSMAVSSDEKYLVFASVYQVCMWDMTNAGKAGKYYEVDIQELRAFDKEHTGGVSAVAISPDGTKVASGGWDKNVRLWDVNTGKQIRCMVGHRTANYSLVTSVSFSPDGQYILSTGGDGSARIWDANTGKERITIWNGSPVENGVFSPDGHYVVTAGGSVRKWRLPMDSN